MDNEYEARKSEGETLSRHQPTLIERNKGVARFNVCAVVALRNVNNLQELINKWGNKDQNQSKSDCNTNLPFEKNYIYKHANSKNNTKH
jgi:hypothetical protein